MSGIPSLSGTKFCHKNRVFVAAHSQNSVVLACTVLIQAQSVTDTQTDRRLDNS